MQREQLDPTVNVKEQLGQAVKRLDDLRQLDQTWARRLLKAEFRRLDAERIQESQRINALLEASTNNVALALEKQSGQAQAQDRRIAVLEQNQYQAGGKDIQRVEQRQGSQFTLQQVIAIAGIGALVLLDLHSRGQI